MIYRTIIADPPWEYVAMPGVEANGRDHRLVQGKSITKILPYASMSVDDICAVPVPTWAADDCRLFLWTTNRYLHDAMHVAEAWGFSYRQTLVWLKRCAPPFGGSVARQFTEYVLVCVKGHPERLSVARSNVIEATRAKFHHSRKPDAFGDLIEAVSPGPYLELFARRQRLGWDTWGDEALNHVEMTA
jgi:N6-adenosine-specific RNA methylase IME4